MKLNELFYYIKRDSQTAKERRIKYDMVRMLLDPDHRKHVRGLDNDTASLERHRREAADWLFEALGEGVPMATVEKYIDDLCSYRESTDSDEDSMLDGEDSEDDEESTETSEEDGDYEESEDEESSDESMVILNQIEQNTKKTAQYCKLAFLAVASHFVLVVCRDYGESIMTGVRYTLTRLF